MNLYRTGGLLLAAVVSTTAVLADVRGVPNAPAFTAEEMELVERDARLVAAAKQDPWSLRRALDAWQESRIASPARAAEPAESVPEEGRTSAEGALILLQILKEAAGQDTKR